MSSRCGEGECVRRAEQCLRLARLPDRVSTVALLVLGALVTVGDRLAPSLAMHVPGLLGVFLAAEWACLLASGPARRWLDRALAAALEGLHRPEHAGIVLRGLCLHGLPRTGEVGLRKLGELLPGVAGSASPTASELAMLPRILAAAPTAGCDEALVALIGCVGIIGYADAAPIVHAMGGDGYSPAVREAARTCANRLSPAQRRGEGADVLLRPAGPPAEEPLPLRVAGPCAATASERRAGLTEGSIE